MDAYRAPSFSWASLDCPISYNSNYRFAPNNVPVAGWDIEVLNVCCTPAGANPLGRVSGGWIKLQGFMNPFSALCQDQRRRWDSRWQSCPEYQEDVDDKMQIFRELILDYPDELPEINWNRVQFLRLRLFSPRDDAFENDSGDDDDGAKDGNSESGRTERKDYSTTGTSQCLVLIPTDRKAGEYLRIGFANVGANYFNNPWIKTVVIVV